MNNYLFQRSILFKWLILFFLTNLVLLELIGLRYLHQSMITNNLNFLTLHHRFNLLLFICTTYITYFFLIASLVFVIPGLCIFFRFHARSIFFLSIVFSAIAASFLLIDTFVYEYYRFHLNLLFLKMVFSFDGAIFNITVHEILFVILMIVILFVIEIIIANTLWNYLKVKKIAFKKYKLLGLLFSLIFYISFTAVVYVNPSFLLRIYLDEVRFLPGILNVYGLLTPGISSKLALTKAGERTPTQSEQLNKNLFYPHHPLVFEGTKKPFNLVIIIIDSWRYDMFNRNITPNIYQFGQQSLRFDNHFSGGNATGPGMFSIFYGLPPTYWTATLAQRCSPVFLDAIQQTYNYKIFSSAQLYSPPLHKTIFQNMVDLETDQQPGKTPTARDILITQKYKQWISNVRQQPKPFFALLFYNSPHSYCETDDHGPFYPNGLCNRLINNDGVDVFNRYKNAAYFVDQQVKEVLETLVQNDLLKNTIVIITSDHGEEFDDNHLGFRGHASNYTSYQLHVPFIMYWPNQTATVFHHLTNHYDIVPTLMKRLLDCVNPPTDFTVGMDLFNKKSRFPFIVGSYIDFGVIEADQVTRFDSVGSYRIEKPNGEINSQGKLRMTAIRDAMSDVRGFYRD